MKPGNEDKESFPTISSGGSGEQSVGGPIEQLGSQIGPYKLLSVLGEGGFGIVYLAEQKEPVRRQVALKVIKPGMDSTQVISRFETERQALALLDHSNIAHVFDAGTTESGRPYFVMEHVKGVPITEHCDQEKLSIEERLILFIQVCEAVQHAHQKGIIHRDIKPSNILVSMQDDKPIPKIIDFGVAKAVSQPLTERTLFTEQGQLLGTPEYMSPEQAQLTNQDIETRSDIYSLGVLLYELLTGALPFDPKTLREAAFDEILRIIREEDPPRPSTRLTSLDEEGKKVAENRRTQLITLTKRLQKELEWIPLKAMRKERSHRYESAFELAEDIRNYLDGNPLIAGPESVAYRLKKYVRRHRALVTGIAAVLVALIGGIIVSTIFAIRVEQESIRTKEESEARRRALYINRIALAEKEIKEGEFAKAQALLDECDADLRSWEWELLNYLSKRIVKTIKLKNQCFSVCFSPEGKRIAFDYYDHIDIWDLASDQVIFVLKAHKQYTNQYINEHGTRPISFSPDGKKIALLHRGQVQMWDIQNGRKLLEFSRGDLRTIEHGDLVFLPSGRCIVAIPESGAGIWDVETGEKLADFTGDDSLMTFAPDGKSLAIRSLDDPCSFCLWDVDANSRYRVLGRHRASITCISFSPDCSFVATGCEDGSIKIWDTETGIEITTLDGHKGPITEVVFSPDSTEVASGALNPSTVLFFIDSAVSATQGVDQSIRIWNVRTGHTRLVLKGHNSSIHSIAFSSTDSRLASVGKDKTAIIWDVKPRSVTLDLPQSEGGDWPADDAGIFLAFTNDGTRVVAMNTTSLSVIKINTCEIASQSGYFAAFDEMPSWYSSWGAAISPDGKQLVVINPHQYTNEDKGILKLVNLRDLSKAITIHVDSPIKGVTYSNCGSTIFLVSEQKVSMIATYSQQKLGELHVPTDSLFTGHVACIGNNKLVLGIHDVDDIRKDNSFSQLLVLDTLKNKEVSTIWDPTMRGVSLSTTPDRKWLIAAAIKDNFQDLEGRGFGTIVREFSATSKVRFWKIDPKQGLKECQESAILKGCVLAFNPDAMRAACVDIPLFNDGVVRLLDGSTGAETFKLEHGNRSVSSVAFSPNGLQIATSGEDGFLMLWGPPTTGDDGFDQ